MYPKKGPHHPRLFDEVLEAIATLKEANGSTKQNIINQVEIILNRKIKRLKHDSAQIQRAIKHGLTHGYIKTKRGKYALDLKDYGVFRKMKNLKTANDLAKQVRRRKGRKRRKRRSSRRRRRHSDVSDTDIPHEDYDDDDDDDEEDDGSSATPGSGTPEDRGRRRRGRGKKRRRRSKRRRHSDAVINIHEAVGEADNPTFSKSSNDDFIKSENNVDIEVDKPPTPTPNNIENNEEPVDSSQNQCDLPECLCNTRKGHQ